MYSAIAQNKRNTVFIILLFLLIIGGLGCLAGMVYGDPIDRHRHPGRARPSTR